MIEVKHLTKKYGNHTAVDNLSFVIEKGQIYGFLGPNGAGKSTTMNIMTGCLASTSGEVKIGGFDIFEQPKQAKQLIGYLPEQPPVYPERTPKEYLTFVAEAKGIAADKQKEQIAKAMKVTGITDVQNRLIKNLSKGYRQRVGIAQAILGDPEVVILDEPTVGLDPKQIIEIRELIQSLGKNHTVILSSHILSEVQAVCQTILIINKGKLVACDTPEKLERMFVGKTTLSVKVEGTEQQIREALANTDFIEKLTVKEDDGICSLTVDGGNEKENVLCKAMFFAMANAKLPILRMTEERASLEDVFIELTDSAEKQKEAKKK